MIFLYWFFFHLKGRGVFALVFARVCEERGGRKLGSRPAGCLMANLIYGGDDGTCLQVYKVCKVGKFFVGIGNRVGRLRL